jgi:imidazolonepropionase-like amidohydrolase
VEYDLSYLEKMADRLRDHCKTVAFISVNVVPMDSERIVEDQIVIVKDGITERIGSSEEVTIPEGCLIVMAHGKYLLPGLADMHVHITGEEDLFLFIAHGVTTVQNMWGYTGLLRWLGFPDQLNLRHKINKGELFGPRIYTAGPVLEGKPRTQPFMSKITTTQKAKKEVAAQKRKGYDFIKVYDHLDVETYSAIISAARDYNMSVKGHVPKAIGLEDVLKSGQNSIEHLTGYIDPDEAEFVIPEDMAAHYAEQTQECGVWNCPTIVVWQKIIPEERIEEMEAHPGMRYLSGRGKFFLKKSVKEMRKNITYNGENYRSRMAEIGYEMVKVLHDAGAKILLGTDAGNPFVFPGWSLHEELQHLVNAGLTPFEALETGTRNPAESLNKRADFVLVKENPLQDIANVAKIAGVMVRGAYLSEMQIAEVLKELAG